MKDLKRAGVAVATLVLLVLAAGCGGKKQAPMPTPPPPPTPTSDQSMNDVKPAPTPTPEGPVEAPVAMSLKELEESARGQGLLGDVFYGFDSYGLDELSRGRLQKNAAFLRSNEGEDLTFTVEGHCDERGTNEYNLALGQRRGSVAVDYLVSLGIERNRFRTVSYGEERPFCTESTGGCWQKNRRARFVVSGRQ
jgi:peptidoglycan-associated lipoprotein